MQFRELFAEREGADAFALLDDIGGAHRRPDAHKEMDVIELHRQFQNRPALLITLLAIQFLAPLANLIQQYLFAALGTPNQMVVDEMNVMFVTLVVQVAHFNTPVDNLR